jgi:hypothetical protein
VWTSRAMSAHVQAQLLADLHTIGQRADRQLCRTEQQRHDWAQTEIAFAMTWTRNRAGGQLVLADQLVDGLISVHGEILIGFDAIADFTHAALSERAGIVRSRTRQHTPSFYGLYAVA